MDEWTNEQTNGIRDRQKDREKEGGGERIGQMDTAPLDSYCPFALLTCNLLRQFKTNSDMVSDKSNLFLLIILPLMNALNYAKY